MNFDLELSIEVLERTRHAVHGFGKSRVSGQRLLIFGQGTLLFTLSDQIEGRVVMVFSFLVIGHEAEILTGLN